MATDIAQIRADVCALHGELVRSNLVAWTSGNVSARVPGEEAFLITPYGMLYEEITASSLIKIDHEGGVLLKPDFPGQDYGVNRAGFVIHSAIHKARPDLACVAHTHT